MKRIKKLYTCIKRLMKENMNIAVPQWGLVLIFTDLGGPSSSPLPVNNNSLELLKELIETSLLGYI